MRSPKYDVHVQFLQDILLQYMCSKTVPTENRIEMKTKEIHSSLFAFHFNYIMERSDPTAVARDKPYCGNSDFFKITGNREMLKTGFCYSNFRYFFERINKHKNQTKFLSKDCQKYLTKGHV